ncbi:uncharacterized protein [Typha angustifolia]|uniref:uncharacterized protein isoform X1 n=1 Tax=Typha angustifolia TaxID=59011 RepID=UPI003C30A16D
MGPESLNGYSYEHLGQKAPQAIDVHEIFIRKNRLRVLLSYVGTITFLASIYYSVMAKEHVCVSSIWSILVGVLVAKCLEYKPVKKESVVIMPAFGVQLETHFWSGRIDRRFVPIGKILKPVLNECVTPVTCYWSLALILRDEDELMLVFMKLHPPVKLLIPVWKALCAASDCED